MGKLRINVTYSQPTIYTPKIKNKREEIKSPPQPLFLQLLKNQASTFPHLARLLVRLLLLLLLDAVRLNH